jgi:hypothetical protein
MQTSKIFIDEKDGWLKTEAHPYLCARYNLKHHVKNGHLVFGSLSIGSGIWVNGNGELFHTVEDFLKPLMGVLDGKDEFGRQKGFNVHVWIEDDEKNIYDFVSPCRIQEYMLFYLPRPCPWKPYELIRGPDTKGLVYAAAAPLEVQKELNLILSKAHDEKYNELEHWLLEKKTQCFVCPKLGDKKCSGCERISYCSVECQKEDWARHKINCGK